MALVFNAHMRYLIIPFCCTLFCIYFFNLCPPLLFTFGRPLSARLRCEASGPRGKVGLGDCRLPPRRSVVVLPFFFCCKSFVLSHTNPLFCPNREHFISQMAKSMALNSAAGLAGMLKAGHKHMEGVDGATLRNIEAAKGLATIVCSSLGPNGMNKLVVNHLEKIIVTSDCATIVKELEIQHPAAKMLELAAEMQEQECGDATNLTVSFAGELLKMCEDLLRMGLHTSEIVTGYKRAYGFLAKTLPSLVCETVTDCRNEAELIRICKPVLAAKQFGHEDVLAPLVAKACLGTMTPNGKTHVNTDSVRVAKVMGGNISQSEVIQGMVVMGKERGRGLGGAEGIVQKASAAKITVFACGIEASATEAKGTVLMKNADDLMR